MVLLTNINTTAKQNRTDQVNNDYPYVVYSGGYELRLHEELFFNFLKTDIRAFSVSNVARFGVGIGVGVGGSI